MGWKSNVMVAATVTALGMGVLSYTDPMKDTPQNNQQVQQQDGDASDSQESVHDQLRRDGAQMGDSDYRDRIGYSDLRPPEELPHIRLRIAP